MTIIVDLHGEEIESYWVVARGKRSLHFLSTENLWGVTREVGSAIAADCARFPTQADAAAYLSRIGASKNLGKFTVRQIKVHCK